MHLCSKGWARVCHSLSINQGMLYEYLPRCRFPVCLMFVVLSEMQALLYSSFPTIFFRVQQPVFNREEKLAMIGSQTLSALSVFRITEWRKFYTSIHPSDDLCSESDCSVCHCAAITTWLLFLSDDLWYQLKHFKWNKNYKCIRSK